MTEQEMRELDAWIAEHVYGWVWMERTYNQMGSCVIRKAIFPPDNKNFIRWNFRPIDWRPADDSTEKFSDWDRCCSAYDGEKFIPPHGLPRYSTDKSTALDVLAKCAESAQGSINIGLFEGLFHLCCRDTKPNDFVAPTLPLAICLFAKKLFEK